MTRPWEFCKAVVWEVPQWLQRSRALATERACLCWLIDWGNTGVARLVGKMDMVLLNVGRQLHGRGEVGAEMSKFVDGGVGSW